MSLKEFFLIRDFIYLVLITISKQQCAIQRLSPRLSVFSLQEPALHVNVLLLVNCTPLDDVVLDNLESC